MKRSYSRLLVLIMALVMSMSMASSVFADDLTLTVNNEYNMFRPTAAVLKDDNMLVLTYSSTSYDKAYVGTAKEAVTVADASKTVSRSEEGTYSLPLDTTEGEIPIAFHSVKNKGWYDRVFVIDKEAETLTTDTLGTPIVPDDYASDWDEEEDISVESTLGMFDITSTKVVVEDNGNVSVKLMAGNNSREFPKIALIEQTATEAEKEAAAIAGAQTNTPNYRIYEFEIPADKLGEKIPYSTYQARNGASEWHDWSTQHYLTVNSAFVVNQLITKIQVQKNTEYTEQFIELSKKCWDALDDDDKEEDDGYFSEDTGDASKDDPLNTAPDKKDELLVVSFGTSFNDSRVETIGAVEKALADRFGNNWAVRRAFTAQIIINHVQSRDGEKIDNVEQAMEKAVAAGVRRLVVQPTHLMSGAEYDELKEAIDKYADKMIISYAKPLLDSDKDKEIVAKAVVAAAAEEAGFADVDAAIADEETAFVFMGHGTEHVANATYTYMQETMDKLGYKNCFIGTVEGLPESTAVDAVLEKVQEAGYTKVVLRPLMVVAGDHANNDMAGDDEDSWKSIFSVALGAENVSTQIKGLGEIEAVQQLYIAHTYPVVEPIIEINNKILELVKNQDLIAAYWKVSEFIDEYKDLVDLIVEQLEATEAGITPEALKEYTDQLDEYIKAMNRYVKEFEDMPEVQDAIERAIKAAEDLKALLEEHGYEIDSLDDILPAIEKAQAELQNALEDLIATIDEEMIQEALEALKEKAAEWAAEAGYNEEDIQKMLDQIAELQAIIEEYAKLTPSEAVDKLIEEATALIADNLDAITDLANEAIDKAVEQWNEGAFDEYLEQLGTSREAIEDLIEDLTAYAIGYFIFDESYIGLQEQLMDALDQIANMEADLQLYKDLWESAEKELKEANAEKAQKDKITKKFINGYKVMKAKPKMIKVKALKKRKAKVTFRGLKKLQATKYQINYKTGKKAKNKTVKKATKTNKKINATLTKLKKGKKYTVKVRATYQFKYAGKTYKFNSKWSKAKKIKAKK